MVVKKALKWVGIGLLTLFLLGVLYGFLGGKSTTTSSETITSTSTATKEILNITFEDFNDLFGTSGTLTDAQKEIRFKEFEGKYVKWECEVVDVRESIGSYVVSFKCDPSTFSSDMRVYLRNDQKEKALTLVKEDDATFIARLKDYSEFLGHTADDGEIVQ